jgi:hypothetical protein
MDCVNFLNYFVVRRKGAGFNQFPTFCAPPPQNLPLFLIGCTGGTTGATALVNHPGVHRRLSRPYKYLCLIVRPGQPAQRPLFNHPDIHRRLSRPYRNCSAWWQATM